MKTFVADIIPRIQIFSKNLDNLSLLIDQHWILLDEIKKTKTVYIFRKKNELLISVDGKVDKARWEYIGTDSILIDIDNKAYLYRHGFFDENILALKFDSRKEYAIFINESKKGGELSNIDDVLLFFNTKYLINPVSEDKKLGISNNMLEEEIFIKNGYTFKMGAFAKFSLKFNSGHVFDIYKKKSNNKYFIYINREIFLFPNKEECISYVSNNIN